MAQRDHMSIMFGINVLDGGVQDKDGTYSCDGPGQGGKGTTRPNCRMTPEQIRDWGLLLGKAGCGLYMWRADGTFMANSGNQQSLRDLAAGLGAAPGEVLLPLLNQPGGRRPAATAPGCPAFWCRYRLTRYERSGLLPLRHTSGAARPPSSILHVTAPFAGPDSAGALAPRP